MRTGCCNSSLRHYFSPWFSLHATARNSSLFTKTGASGDDTNGSFSPTSQGNWLSIKGSVNNSALESGQLSLLISPPILHPHCLFSLWETCYGLLFLFLFYFFPLCFFLLYIAEFDLATSQGTCNCFVLWCAGLFWLQVFLLRNWLRPKKRKATSLSGSEPLGYLGGNLLSSFLSSSSPWLFFQLLALSFPSQVLEAFKGCFSLSQADATFNSPNCTPKSRGRTTKVIAL